MFNQAPMVRLTSRRSAAAFFHNSGRRPQAASHFPPRRQQQRRVRPPLRRSCAAPPRCSWPLQESEVEGCEHEHDSYIHRQPFPEPVLEEQDVDCDDHNCHQDYVECGGRPASHISLRVQGRRPSRPCELQRHVSPPDSLFPTGRPRPQP